LSKVPALLRSGKPRKGPCCEASFRSNVLTVFAGYVIGFFLQVTGTVGLVIGNSFLEVWRGAEGVMSALDDAAHGRMAKAKADLDTIGEQMKAISDGTIQDVKDIWNPKDDKGGTAGTTTTDGDGGDEETPEIRAAVEAAEKKKTLSNEVAQLEEKNRFEALSGEQQLNDLYRQRNLLQLGQNSGQFSSDDQLKGKKELLGVEDEIQKREAKARGEREKAAQHVAEIEEKNRLEAMTGEQRLQELIKQRANLLKQTGNGPDSERTTAQLDAEAQALEMEKQIGEQKAKNDKEAEDRAKVARDGRASYANALDQAKGEEGQEGQDRKFKKMSPKQQREFFEEKGGYGLVQRQRGGKKGQRPGGSQAAYVGDENAGSNRSDGRSRKTQTQRLCRRESFQLARGGRRRKPWTMGSASRGPFHSHSKDE